MKVILLILQIVITKFVIRKEIRDMTDEEWDKYKTAFNLFKEKGYLAYIAKIHIEVDTYAHKNGRFLPWHRMLLLYVESILQMLTKDYDMSIPYWDWTIDASDPDNSFIFTEKYWGIKECYLVTYPYEHCLLRNKKTIEPFYSKKDIDRLLTKKGSYNEFRDVLELIPHALVHANVGGEEGDMSQMFSPNDPVFWHHHSFIDYIWHQKQLKGLKNSYGGTDNNKKLEKSERLYPFNKQVEEVLDITKCKIKFKPFKYFKTMTKVTKASELNADYIKLHDYDTEKVRKYEQFMRGESKKSLSRKIYEWLTGNTKMT
ncbi:hypothetical protein P3W45_001459 [Vairimorpha bombi]|jgi:hypothetical protein